MQQKSKYFGSLAMEISLVLKLSQDNPKLNFLRPYFSDLGNIWDGNTLLIMMSTILFRYLMPIVITISTGNIKESFYLWSRYGPHYQNIFRCPLILGSEKKGVKTLKIGNLFVPNYIRVKYSTKGLKSDNLFYFISYSLKKLSSRKK